MAASDLTIDEILHYFKINNNVVQNRELVHYFKHYLTNPASKDDARLKFKKFVNTIAHTRLENDVKYLELKTKYRIPLAQKSPPDSSRHQVGIPVSPSRSIGDHSSSTPSKSPRQPPPYRPPPPVASPLSESCDNISLSSLMSLQDSTPQPPPRRRSAIDRQKSLDELESTAKKADNSKENQIGDDKQKVSVKERLEKFNRLASVEDDLSGSPRTPKSCEKSKNAKGVDEDDVASVTSLEPKKCMEWYVMMSKGDVQELVKLAKDEPRLVNRKDPFTSVLHWGAKRGSPEIIKIFAGRYKVDVNSKTGYTPLHIAAQFGRTNVYELLLKVYHADDTVRDYSGRLPIYYQKNGKEEQKVHAKLLKSRKKQSDKDLGFLRIGSLNVRVKKTTEAFSNFLGVGGGSINPLEAMDEKAYKGWGSADNLNQEIGPNKPAVKKKPKRPYSSGLNSTPGTPKQLIRSVNSRFFSNDSDSDTAAGFDSEWKH